MKRIICSILVVVMLALSFASCGYNVEDDDMTSYATFADAEMKAFKEALKAILIEDGDFTAEDEKREAAVMEMVYAAVADAMGTDAEKLTEGTPDGRDLIYYSYYMSADFDGKTAIFYPAKMNSTSPVSIQLLDGGDFGDDTLSQKIADLLATHDFANMAYASVSSGNTFEGDIAYVTYTKTEGDKEPVVHTNERLVIGKDKGTAEIADSFESHLCGAKIGSSSTIAEYSVTSSDGTKVTYSSIKVNFVINRVKTGNTTEGDRAYVTYTKKIGDEAAKILTNQLVVVGKAPAEGVAATTLAELIANREIGTKLVKDDENKTEITLEVTEDEKKVVYSAITVNWIEGDGKPLGEVKDAPFEEKTLVKDVEGVERDLNGKEITYYIYPVNYIDVPDYTADYLIEKIILDPLAKSASSSSLTQEELLEKAIDALVKIIYVDEYAKLYYNEDTTSEQMEELLDELAARADQKYSKKNEEGKDVKFSDALKLIVAYYKDIADAETAKTNASDALAEAQKVLDDAEIALEEAKNSNASADEIKKLEDDVKAAKEAIDGKEGEAEGEKTGARADVEKAEANYKKVEEKKATDIKFLLSMTLDEVALSTTFYNGYKVEQYYSLQYSYNEEIKNKLGEEIYFFITEYVKINEEGDLPEDLVDDAYTKLYETYENKFYTGNYDNSESNYKHYGSFEKYLVAVVNEDEAIKEALAKDATSFGEAKDILREYAEYITIPVVQVFRFADAFDVTISNSDYEDYKDEIEDWYYKIYGIRDFDVVEIYGENSLKMAAQLDKILDWLLEYKEADGVKVDIYTKIEYKYECELLGKYEFGDPASKAEKNEK